nr:ComEC/Rec2 family competence protein [Dysgonomonas sp. 25]
MLIPLAAGILVQYYFSIEGAAIPLFFLGGGLMLLSYLIAPSKQYALRWLFGAGLFLFVAATGMWSTHNRQSESKAIAVTSRTIYKGVVMDIPQDKPKSVAYKTYLPDYGKKVVCYFQLNREQEKLQPGDVFLFEASIRPFSNMPDSGFDYVGYMYDQGYAGSAYIPIGSWVATSETDYSLHAIAQRFRQRILDFYRSLGFDESEFALLAALTVGYQDALSDDLKQSFRATGTVHVLAVSGLHVGIIYLMIAFSLGFIPRTSRFYRLRPALIILLLWVYAFICGLSPSVTRASLMLSVLCIAELVNRRSYSIHALYIAAFFILLHNPFSLFQVSFQLSFASVLGILYLHPKLAHLFNSKNKAVRYLWNAFTLSCVAQLATFPLCLYYFGTFPTYFFITNLLVVPLATLIIYSFALIMLSKGISALFPTLSDYAFAVPVKLVQFLLRLLTECVRFFEGLPLAQISDIEISLWQMFIIVLGILIILLFCERKGFFVKEYQK